MELSEMLPEHRRFLEENLRIEGLQPYGLPLINSLKAWEYIHTHNEITLDRILELHRITMEGLMDHPGEFRTTPVWIRKRVPNVLFLVSGEGPVYEDEFHQTVKPEKIIPFLSSWAFLSDLDSHLFFECVHPFLDGNGRVGRFLWAWARRIEGLDIYPILDLFSGDGFPEKRAHYYLTIQRFKDEHFYKEDLYNDGKVQRRPERAAPKPQKRRSQSDAGDAADRVGSSKNRKRAAKRGTSPAAGQK